jgi:hypothetical protein
MATKTHEPTSRQRERAFLVGVDIYNQDKLLSLEDSLTELSLLAQTAGLDIAGQAYQKLDRPNPQTLIGSGKVQEILILANEVRADLILFDEELSPRHLRELEHIFGAATTLFCSTDPVAFHSRFLCPAERSQQHQNSTLVDVPGEASDELPRIGNTAHQVASKYKVKGA